MTTTGMRERKKLETAQALSDAALDLAWADGLEALTVEAIAERANVTSRTFFNYFASKEDAVLGIPKFESAADAPTSADGRSAFDQARGYIRALLAQGSEHPERLLMRRAVQSRHPQLIIREYSGMMAAGGRIMPWLTGILAAQEPGLDERARDDRAQAILLLLGSGYQLAASRWTQGDTADEPALPELFDAALDELLAVAVAEATR